MYDLKVRKKRPLNDRKMRLLNIPKMRLLNATYLHADTETKRCYATAELQSF